MAHTNPPQRRTRKIAAVAAGILVIGIGATYTLASWTDSEWVWGGADGTGTPIIGTSTFEVVQNTTKPYDNTTEANWVNRESNPGDPLQFSPTVLSMTPGDKIYAPVSLKTSDDSLAATTTLQAAVPAAGTQSAPTHDAALAAAVRVTVYTANTAQTAPPPTACTDGFTADGWSTLLNAVPLATTATATQTLAADGQTVQHYCFVVELPDTTANQTDSDLQGKRISPAWQFSSTS